MTIDGAKIYNEGVGIGHDCEEKIRQIMTTVKTVSPTSEVSLRFLKSGRSYEALLWGRADSLPIGVFNRGPSMPRVLDTVYRNVKRQCLKARNLKARNRKRVQLSDKEATQSYSQEHLALAG